MSETSSDAPKTKKRREYPEPFEALWKNYPTDANMSKAEAFDAWKRLDAADKDALAASIGPFRAYCRANPDYRPIHLCRFIAKRRFDGHQANVPVDDPETWRKRLGYARREHRWSPAWGPKPGELGCRAPENLVEAGDGAGWSEWESAA